MKLTCNHCGHSWTYTGIQLYQTTCGVCGYKVSLSMRRGMFIRNLEQAKKKINNRLKKLKKNE